MLKRCTTMPSLLVVDVLHCNFVIDSDHDSVDIGHARQIYSTDRMTPRAKTIKKNTNSTQNKFQTHRAKQYEVTSFLSTDCDLSTETCSKFFYSLGPKFRM